MKTHEIKINDYVSIVIEFGGTAHKPIVSITNTRGEEEYKFQEMHLYIDTLRQILAVAESEALKVLYND